MLSIHPAVAQEWITCGISAMLFFAACFGITACWELRKAGRIIADYQGQMSPHASTVVYHHKTLAAQYLVCAGAAFVAAAVAGLLQWWIPAGLVFAASLAGAIWTSLPGWRESWSHRREIRQSCRLPLHR